MLDNEVVSSAILSWSTNDVLEWKSLSGLGDLQKKKTELKKNDKAIIYDTFLLATWLKFQPQKKLAKFTQSSRSKYSNNSIQAS